MTTHHSFVSARPASKSGVHPFPRWVIPFWLAFIGSLWWDSIERATNVAALASSSDRVKTMMVGFGVLGHFAANLLEAAGYRLWWRSVRRLSIPFWALFNWLVSFSVIDLLSDGVRRLALRHPDFSVWLAPLAGVAALDPNPLHAGLAAAFGNFGLFTALRIVATAAIQRRLVGIGWGEALAVVVPAWIVTRLLIWWSVDLFAGRSALG
ncbi:MAG TPA: hypothetical protein VFQ05_15470 [Candidatus Eisenbacteria bacterium]|nr:hypothetical protein [Candidatus Eisenbacteria bacterium]